MYYAQDNSFSQAATLGFAGDITDELKIMADGRGLLVLSCSQKIYGI